MTQTVVPPPAPSGAPAPTSATAAAARARRAGTVQALLAVVRRELAGTPGRLRVISAGAVLAALLGALLGGWALQMRSSALDRAGDSAAHLVLLQGVQTRLAQADAEATNGYLQTGPEPQAKLQAYGDAISRAGNDLAIATQGGPDDAKNAIRAASQDLAILAKSDTEDADGLAAANAALVEYAGLIEAGRVYKADRNLVGGSFVLSGTQLMQAQILAPIEARTKADSEAIDDAYSTAGNARWLLAIGVIVGLGGLLIAQRQISRQSHRYVNVPLVVGTVLLLLGFGVAGANMAGAQSKADDVRDGVLKSSTQLSQARVAAFQAKSIESRTLIQRGTATEQDAAWTERMKVAQALRTPEAAVGALKAYAAKHVAANKLDANGDWAQARDAVVAGGKGSADAAFQTFADSTSDGLRNDSDRATQALADAGNTLLPAGVALVILGLIAAGAAWWGVSQRLGEYR
jgi:hypothetical protein